MTKVGFQLYVLVISVECTTTVLGGSSHPVVTQVNLVKTFWKDEWYSKFS